MKKTSAPSPKPKASSQQQIAVMLELLRAGVLDRDPVLDSNVKVDWDALMDRASKHGILAWIYDGICKLPLEQQPPRQHRINWALSAQEIWARYAKQKEVLADMVKVCDENGMRMLLLKGIGLSELYPKPESRPSGDIDVYFFDEFEKGNELFCSDVLPKFNKKHTEFNYMGIHIENHQSLLDSDTPHRRKVANYIKSTLIESENTQMGYTQLDPISNLIYLLMHINHHYHPAMSLPIRQYIDIVIFLRSNIQSIQPQEFRLILKQLRLDSFFEIVLSIGELVLGIELDAYHMANVSKTQKSLLCEFIMQGGLFGNAGEKLSDTMTMQNWAHYYYVLFFIGKHFGHSFFSLGKVIIRHALASKLKELFGVPKEKKLFGNIL